MRNRSRHIAGRINEASKSPRVFQGKIVGNNNDGTIDVEVGGSTYYNVQCVTWLITDNATGCWIMELGSGKWIVFGTNGGSTVTLDARLTVNDIVDVSEYIRTPAVHTYNGGRLILSAGESLTLAMDNTGPDDEYVYVVAENGLQVIASTDNWATGWAGSKYIKIRPDQGMISFDDSDLRLFNGPTVLKVQNQHGYVNVGPANTGYSHFSTDRDLFYFNKPIQPLALQTYEYGSETDPSVRSRFVSNAGMYFDSAGRTLFSQGGSLTWQMGITAHVSQLPVWFPDGTSSAPSITFKDDPDTGFQRAGTGIIEAVGNASRIWYGNSSTFYVPGFYTDTTASAANLNVISGGRTRRSTSSIKYKTDVIDLADDVADRIFQLRPVRYRSLCEADPSEYSYYGLIAEEVAEVDPRLVHWDEGQPEGVQYDRIVPHLISVIKRLDRRVAALEAIMKEDHGRSNDG